MSLFLCNVHDIATLSVAAKLMGMERAELLLEYDHYQGIVKIVICLITIKDRHLSPSHTDKEDLSIIFL